MIFENSGFGRNLGILEKGMDANRQRAGVIANNIANVNVPNFKRSEVNFEAQLKRAVEGEAMRDKQLQINHVSTRKVQFSQMLTWDKVEPQSRLDYLSEVKQNGNNVDIERESIDARKNSMSYQLLAEMVRFQFSQIAVAVR